MWKNFRASSKFFSFIFIFKVSQRHLKSHFHNNERAACPWLNLLAQPTTHEPDSWLVPNSASVSLASARLSAAPKTPGQKLHAFKYPDGSYLIKNHSRTWGSFPGKNFEFEVKLQIWGHFGSNFKIEAKSENHISKWSSWHHLFINADVKVIRGHPRSKIAKKSSFMNLRIK